MSASSNVQAREQAYAAAATLIPEPTSRVEYFSQGRVLVLGMDLDTTLDAARRLRPALTPAILLTGSGDSGTVDGIPVLYTGGREPLIQGFLGAFLVTLDVGDQTANVATLLDRSWQRLDLILDLGLAPLIAAEWPPVGYSAPPFGDPEALDLALANLAELQGEFEKPKFFRYNPDICAHNRNGITGCTRCLEACPALAIRSLGETVEVQPELCQGGGICASVCPTGAMTYTYPTAQDLLARVQVLLETYHGAGGTDAVLVFYDDEAGAEAMERVAALPDSVLAVEVDEIGAIGPEIWLTSVALGAREVLLLDVPTLPARVRRNLQEQLSYTQELLRGLGYPPEALRLQAETGLQTLPAHPFPALAPWTLPVLDPAAAARPATQETSKKLSRSPGGSLAADQVKEVGRKRQLLYQALDRLIAAATTVPDVIVLPTGAPFGEVLVDPQRCTLCLACAAVCPAQALNASGETPRLNFTEARCVQCGICAQSCPEDAITLQARLCTQAPVRNQSRVLHEEAPFACVVCGKPFATRSMIDRISAKLEAHPMFQDAASRQRLQMCEDCRVVDMFRSEAGRK